MSTPQKESPESVAAEFRAEGIEGLRSRVDRYGAAKQRSLDVSLYLSQGQREEAAIAARLAHCGEYLLFRHYPTIDEVRLHAAQFCRKSLLCPLCAIRRGSKALGAYLDRWQAIEAQKPLLRPFLVTLTVKDGPDLLERFQHLQKGQRELWMRKHRRRGSVLDCVEGAVWSYEVKRGKVSGEWHPHLHMIALAELEPDQAALSAEWREITGDSFIVDVRPLDDQVGGFCEVFKYAVKFSDMTIPDTVECWTTLRSRRLIGSAGVLRGVVVPESLLDEPLDDLPYVDYLYRYWGGGYELKGG